MFLDTLIARNPHLIHSALCLHREGRIPPNTFVIDIDTVAENAALLGRAAKESGLRFYFTTKQIGFNPLIAARVSQAGIPKAIAIDFREASVLSQHHIAIGHLGHLVQLPVQSIAPALEMEPEVITVFGLEKARQISQAAFRAGKEAGLLLRVVSEGDFFYPGQEGGIGLDTLAEEAAAIRRLPNVRIAGVTSYPCLQFDEEDHALKPTQNFSTILRAAEVLRRKVGVRVEQINAPGNTCVGSVPILAQMGATHGEPGHALTGTTYLHTNMQEPEAPALIYISEVSHVNGDRAYFFGGLTHRRAKILHGLVGSGPEDMTKTSVQAPEASAIDYYLSLSLPDHHPVRVGDSVVLAPRAQVFVSRSYVAVVQGIAKGEPELLGLYDAGGRPVESPGERV
ncbi:MAG: alanine racemase [Anaerolineales bacterium]